MDFSNVKLAHKLLIMLTLPIIVLLTYSSTTAFKAYNVRVTMLQLEELSELAVYAGNFVHNTQAERGATAIFLSSKGTRYVTELKGRRDKTDKTRTALLQFLEHYDASDVSDDLDAIIKKALSIIEQLNNSRKLIDNLEMTLPEALKYYTGSNTVWLNTISMMSSLSDDAGLAIQATAYVNYLQNKERAGIERAVLAGTFTRDSFSGSYARFLNLVAAQENYTKVFLSLATQTSIDFYNKTMTGEFVTETQRMRDIANERAVTGGFEVDPAYWFKMQSGKINLLKTIEDYLAMKLKDNASVLLDEANMSLIFSTIIAVGSLLISVVAAYYIGRGILTQLGGEPGEIEDLANEISNGNLSFKNDTSRDSTGVYKAMMSMRTKLTKVIESDVQTIVDKAKSGDLSQRIDLQNKQGFYKNLSQSINELVDVNEQVINDTVKMFSAMSNGDLSHQIKTDYQGEFNQLKQDANNTIKKLTLVIEGDIQSIVDNARRGELSHRIPVDDKQGFFKVLSEGVNELIDVSEQVTTDTLELFGALANGDLTKTINKAYQGSYKDIQDNANSTINKLTSVITEIRHASHSVDSGAREISDGNLDLSQRTEEQASALQETAASMEQMTSTVGESTDNAIEASKLAVQAQTKAESGGAVVNDAMKAMDNINQASHEISSIISVIDEIAFQTNLLALNAAVEAARAGEQGRGFAVVAAEVRNLAQRSANAAKEIKGLIKDSVDKVEYGSKLVNDSGKTLDEIVEAITTVSDMIQKISDAAREQNDGIEQVNIAISQMDESTQQNAALVEQASAASENMAEQAASMSELMAFFTTESNR